MATSSFVDLRMWQKAHQFVLEMYNLTANYPKHELFLFSISIS